MSKFEQALKARNKLAAAPFISRFQRSNGNVTETQAVGLGYDIAGLPGLK